MPTPTSPHNNAQIHTTPTNLAHHSTTHPHQASYTPPHTTPSSQDTQTPPISSLSTQASLATSSTLKASAPSISSYIKHLLSLMRPHQYSKNLFLFAPAFFGFGQYHFDRFVALYLLIAFVGFCLVASGIYALNDCFDAPSDRLHPEKSTRPVASGALSIRLASSFGIVLLLIGIAIYIYIYSGIARKGSAPSMPSTTHVYLLFSLILPLLLYIVINLAYCAYLKHIAIIDIFCIASGFVLRLWVGAHVIDVGLSHWIVITTFLLALFLALAKRRDDLLLLEKGITARRNIHGYNRVFLDIAMGISASLVMVAYIFYSIDADVNNRLNTHNLYLTSVFVLLGIFRYMQITFVLQKSSSPSTIMLRDRFLQAVIIAWLISFLAIAL